MKRKIIVTGDGSKTIHLEDWNEQYHSKYGAIQEAYHVFIKNGLNRIDANKISILEMGFGTGLNAFITYLESHKSATEVDYFGVEAYPIDSVEVAELNYTAKLDVLDGQHVFKKMHDSLWEEKMAITPSFYLTKYKLDFRDVLFKNQFDLIYFDAFGPRVQPELWSQTIFEKMFNSLKTNGWLTTYSAKGDVRRAMQKVGFTVQRIEGPPGKREMLVAQKS